MITCDPFMMLLALVSLLFAAVGRLEGDKFWRAYLLCFIVSIVGAYVVPT